MIALFSIKLTKAETFAVTTNADDGPGSLREALAKAAANGTNEQDIITFVLPDISEAGRTITLLADLPAVSSNLQIAAPTHLGGPFGVTDANVIIAASKEAEITALLSLNNVSNVEIYNIGFRGNWHEVHKEISGIRIENSANIQIGRVTGGNSFTDLWFGILVKNSHDITLHANISGLKFDGVTPDINYIGFYAEQSYNLNIGGSFITQRNTLSNYGQGDIILQDCQDVKVSNNFIGTDYSGNRAIGPSFIGENYSAYGVSAVRTDNISIDNNIFGNLGLAIALFDLRANYNISGNKIGTGFSAPNNLNNRTAIGIYNSEASGTIKNNQVAYNGEGVIVSASGAATITQNSFYCNLTNAIKIIESPVPVPFINVTGKTASQVTGTATPNTTIELFYTDECQLCQGKTFIDKVIADNSGNWTYTGVLNGAVVATATNAEGVTSGFSSPEIFPGAGKVKDAVCGSDGAITGFKYANATSAKWLNESGQMVGTDLDLVGVAAGKYKLQVDNGTCSVVSDFYEVKDHSFSIDASKVAVKDFECGVGGSVTGLSLINNGNIQLSVTWINSNGDQADFELTNLKNALPGSYTLHVSAEGNCEKTYGPVVIKDNAVIINQGNAVTTAATCDNYDGGIAGVTVTGGSNNKYVWKNEAGAEFKTTTADLAYAPAGSYTLTVTSGSGCSKVSDPITIRSIDGISISGTPIVRSESCDGNNGSITGLTITGATKIEWRRASDNQLVGSNADLTNIPAGDYVLTASNATCSSYPRPFNIQRLADISFPDFAVTATPACSDVFTNGQLSINTDNAPSQPAGFIWMDATGTEIGYGKSIGALAPGIYKLDLIDANGCRRFYKQYTIDRYPPFTYSPGAVTDIQCGVGTGTISAPQISGGRGAANYVFSWYKEGVLLPGETQATLANALAGNYRLHVEDGGCSSYDIPYTIHDFDLTPPPPVVPDIRVAGAGSAQLIVTDPYPTAIYQLYDTETSITPTDSEIGGKFNIFPTENRSYYVSLTYGRCESARTKVNVSLCITANDIANTFTPNADGSNDTWQIPGLEFNSVATVKVFNRYGKMVFNSKGYSKPFDGTFNGKPLPFGTYYYIINTGTECGQFSGNVTIIR